jgi:hypothetical protein
MIAIMNAFVETGVVITGVEVQAGCTIPFGLRLPGI